MWQLVYKFFKIHIFWKDFTIPYHIGSMSWAQKFQKNDETIKFWISEILKFLSIHAFFSTHNWTWNMKIWNSETGNSWKE